jgi:penicillin-binding protein 1A
VRIRLFDADLVADPGRIWERKIKEALLALQVGDRYPGIEGKQKLLEMYLNQVYYGNNVRHLGGGISLPRQGHHLDAPADQLTIGEAALLAGLVRAPRPSIRRNRSPSRSTRTARRCSTSRPTPAPWWCRASCSTGW